jgi:O-antigen/teichoic acid export membrane protein
MTATGTGPEPESGPPSMRGRIANVAMASAGAQAIGEIISFVQTIVLARLLGPEIVGIFAAGTVLTTFLANFAEGGMRSGLVHRDRRDLADATETVFWGTIVTGILMSLGALAAAPLIAIVFDSHTAGLVAATSSGALLLYSLTNVPEAMLQREFSVKRRLIVGPTIAFSFAVVSVAMAAMGYGVWSLVAGTYVSYVAWVVTVWLITDWRPGRGGFSFRMWRELARFGFPLVVGFVGARFQQMVESVVVGRGLNTTALGYYRYGVRISRIPVSATLEVVANALFPAFSRMRDDPPRLRSSFLQALSYVTFFSAAISGLAFAVGEPAVVILLGEPWRGAGIAVMAMAGLGLGKAFTSVSEEAMKGCGRTPLVNYMTITEVVLGIGLLVLIIPFGLVGVGLAISLTALAVGVQGLVIVRKVVGVEGRETLRIIAPMVIACVAAAGATYALEHLVLHADERGLLLGLGCLLLDALLFVLVYSGVMLVLAPKTVRPIMATAAGAVRRIRRRLVSA